MIIVEICVGSSCHLKGAPQIVDMLSQAIKENCLEDYVVPTGSFCTGNCNRIGVTISINDELFTGVTPESFRELLNEKIVKPALAEKG